MPFDTRVKQKVDLIQNTVDDRINNPIKVLEDFNRLGNLINPAPVIQDNPNRPIARRNRQKIMWRIPGLGFVQMYINPQQMVISEKKVIQKQRTKGGFVLQYWGEDLGTVKLDGHGGSGGIEAINILRKVYRAEQHAFEGVASSLVNQLKHFANVQASTFRAGQDAIGQSRGFGSGSLFGNSANPSLMPTLGSLAAAVELYYQGWVFKGFFENFDMTESVTDGVGIFKYSLTFTYTDRRGTRHNFMPWHKEPAIVDNNDKPTKYRDSDSGVVPLSFGGEEE